MEKQFNFGDLIERQYALSANVVHQDQVNGSSIMYSAQSVDGAEVKASLNNSDFITLPLGRFLKFPKFFNSVRIISATVHTATILYGASDVADRVEIAAATVNLSAAALAALESIQENQLTAVTTPSKVAVGVASTQLVAASTPRRLLVLQNDGPDECYIGPAGAATVADGFQLANGKTVEIPTNARIDAICNTAESATVRVMEWS